MDVKQGGIGCGFHDEKGVESANVCFEQVEVEEETVDGVEDEEEETDADYRARMMHIDTFLRLNDSISTLHEIGKNNPEYALEVQKILHSSVPGDDNNGGVPEKNDLGGQTTTTKAKTPTSNATADGDENATEKKKRSLASETCHRRRSGNDDANDIIKIKTHAHLIYHGDLLQLSKETVTLSIPRRDMTLFTRIIDNFKRMIMGEHTDEDVANMRRDHDTLITMWDDTPIKAVNIGGEIKNMMRSMLDTPLYYTNSCMALIACGQMLRNLYTETEGGGRAVSTYEQLMGFVRKHMRHNPSDPFQCDCRDDDEFGRCSEECKTLMSMIMEVPTIVHNQTYLLQILAYIMYDKSGREEVFINNLKNTCSPGLLDRVPTRLAMLMGTLDETEIRRRYKAISKQNPLKERTIYSKTALESLVQLVHSPRMQAVIESLPGARVATVELRLPKCSADKKNCLNKEFDEKSIMMRKLNNNGKNKCCGYLRQSPFDLLASSISLAQLLVYVFTDPRSASTKSRRHFFIRDIITSMARQTVKIKLETLEEMFCYLDRTRVFKSFNEHPLMMAALQELFTSYIDYMKDAAEKYKETGKKRRIKRYMKKNGVSDTVL